MIQLPLIEIILYIALFFAPPDATHISVAGPDYSIELTREKTAWTSGPATFTALDDSLIRDENAKKETTSVAAFVKAALNHDWSRVSKIKLQDSATLEKTASGFFVRVNDGDPAMRTYTITYRRPAPPATTKTTSRPLTINVLGAVNRPGAYPLPAGATLLDALAAAGGGSPTAQLRKLPVVRGPAGATPAVIPHDANAILRGQSANPALLDRDTVFVPESLL